MNVKVDISSVKRATRAAAEDIRGFLVDMEHTLKEAAMTERFTHAYQNQTTHLQASTGATVESDSDNELVVVLEMGEDYASYVIDRGYSDFPEIAERAQQTIDRQFARVGRRAEKR